MNQIKLKVGNDTRDVKLLVGDNEIDLVELMSVTQISLKLEPGQKDPIIHVWANASGLEVVAQLKHLGISLQLRGRGLDADGTYSLLETIL